MTTGTVIKSIAAIIAALGVEGIGKGRKNLQQGYSFRGIDDAYNALSPLLAQHGLVIIPRMLDRQVWERESAKGNALFYVVVTAEFDFISSEDGSMVTARTFGEGMDSADKATNKAMSAAYKYAVWQTFCVPIEGSGSDSEEDSHDVKGPKGAGQSRAGGPDAPKSPPAAGQAPPTRPGAAPKADPPPPAPKQPVQGQPTGPTGPRKRPTPSGDMEIDRLKFDELSDAIKTAKDESGLKVAFLDAYQFAGDIDDDRIAKPWQMEATKLKDERKKAIGLT